MVWDTKGLGYKRVWDTKPAGAGTKIYKTVKMNDCGNCETLPDEVRELRRTRGILTMINKALRQRLLLTLKPPPMARPRDSRGLISRRLNYWSIDLRSDPDGLVIM